MLIEDLKKYLIGEWKCTQYQDLHFKYDGENMSYCINNRWSTLHDSKLDCVMTDLSEVRKICLTPIGLAENYVYVIPKNGLDIVDCGRGDVLHFERQ